LVSSPLLEDLGRPGGGGLLQLSKSMLKLCFSFPFLRDRSPFPLSCRIAGMKAVFPSFPSLHNLIQASFPATRPLDRRPLSRIKRRARSYPPPPSDRRASLLFFSLLLSSRPREPCPSFRRNSRTEHCLSLFPKLCLSLRAPLTSDSITIPFLSLSRTNQRIP